MWQFLAENKESLAVVAALVTGAFGVLAAVLSKKKTIIHKIVTIGARPAAPANPSSPEASASPASMAEVAHPESQKAPRVELLPAFPTVRSDAPTILDVLVRVVPPAGQARATRPTVNLGLVLDRSGSMAAENKIGFAREAAIYAVEQLQSSDRVSVTIFDDRVETIVPNTLVTDKERILRLIRQVTPGRTTALQAAWLEGCKQVSRFQVKEGLNRVLLLSDGIANVGETNADVIATDVKKWSGQGVSSTAMGVGTDYNEDLLEAMARSGDGNYYYIQSAGQLPHIFRTELQGLLLTVGTRVSLGIEPLNGVTVTDVLNDLERTEFGRLKLSNLIAGMPIEVVVRLSVPPKPGPAELCRFRVAWDAAGAAGRQLVNAVLALPSEARTDGTAPAANAKVEERAVLLLAARLKMQAAKHLEKGDREAAGRCISAAKELLGTVARSAQVEQEMEAIGRIEENLDKGEIQQCTKEAKYQRYWRTLNRPET